jgi:2-dehydro-3-deoxyphosphooctonate aldolase (KDO 8-P synthase)
MITIKQLQESKQFFLIAGPCVVEDETSPYRIAYTLKEITEELKIPFIFKASYRKANRTRFSAFTGIGNEKALGILLGIRSELKIPVLTDIHSAYEAEFAAQFVDILQIPAFLCRQTDILIAAAKTGRIINIKKGQFANTYTINEAAEKVHRSGNRKILITERGKTFGSDDLVIDFREVGEMCRSMSYPIVLDITHSIGKESSNPFGHSLALAKAGIAVGVDGIFMETHSNPAEAKSDGERMILLDKVENLLKELVKIRKAITS